MLSKEVYVEEIWQLFTKKIEVEWIDKFASYGHSLEEIHKGQKTKFTHAILSDINKKVNNPDLLVSFDTMHRILTSGKLSPNQKNITFEMLCRYLGYQSWWHFQRAIDKQKIIQETQQNKPFQPQNLIPSTISSLEKETEQEDNKKRRLVLLFSISIAALSPIIYYFASFSNTISELDASTLIKAANQAEFDAYQALPELDTAALRKYFTPDGTAYSDAIELILKSHQKGRQLLPPSGYEIVEIQAPVKKEDYIYVKTRERWKLLWCDPVDARGFLYDTLNHQEYYLKLHDNQWKVDVNYYQGRAKRPATPVGVCE